MPKEQQKEKKNGFFVLLKIETRHYFPFQVRRPVSMLARPRRMHAYSPRVLRKLKYYFPLYELIPTVYSL